MSIIWQVSTLFTILHIFPSQLLWWDKTFTNRMNKNRFISKIVYITNQICMTNPDSSGKCFTFGTNNSGNYFWENLYLWESLISYIKEFAVLARSVSYLFPAKMSSLEKAEIIFYQFPPWFHLKSNEQHFSLYKRKRLTWVSANRSPRVFPLSSIFVISKLDYLWRDQFWLIKLSL